jgi:hypothetical protein
MVPVCRFYPLLVLAWVAVAVCVGACFGRVAVAPLEARAPARVAAGCLVSLWLLTVVIPRCRLLRLLWAPELGVQGPASIQGVVAVFVQFV